MTNRIIRLDGLRIEAQLRERAMRILNDGLTHEPAAIFWAARTAYPGDLEVKRSGDVSPTPLSKEEQRIAVWSGL